MNQHVDINPQAVLVIAEQLLQAGWIQGNEQGQHSGTNDSEDLQGVCIVGALRNAVCQVLRPQVQSLCAAIPEFMTLQPAGQETFVDELVRRYENPLICVFRKRFAQMLGSPKIEVWNDTSGRTKQEVLEATRATLEIVTQECLATWDQEVGSTEHSAALVTK